MREILGVIAGITLGLLGILGVSGYMTTGQSKNIVTTTMSQILMWEPNLFAAYISQPNKYGTASIAAATLIGLGINPPGTSPDGSTLVNPAGGTITVAGNANQTVFVTYNGYKATDCAAILTQMSATSGVIAVAAGPTGSLGSLTAPPFADTAAIAACSGATNSLEFQLP